MSFFQLKVQDNGGGNFGVSERGSASQPVPVRFDPQAGFASALDNLSGRPPDGPMSLQNQEPIADEIGRRLFETFFPAGVVRKAFKAYRDRHPRPRLALHLPSSLFRFPWEVLKDPEDYPGKFLSLIGSVVRVIESRAAPVSLKELLSKHSLKFLAISANPKDRVVLGDFSWRSSKRVKFQRLNPATFTKFQSTLGGNLECDGFVFWGHGDINNIGVGELVFVQRNLSTTTIWTYSSDRRDADRIALEILPTSPLRLGYVLACESASWGLASGKGLLFANSVVAKLLEKTPLGLVVGAQTALNVNAAESYLNDSIGAIRSDPSIPLDLALTQGRKGIYQIPQQSFALDWWVPVIYVKPDCLEELDRATLPLDPSVIPLPQSIAAPTASPSGGLSPQSAITTLGALSRVAASTVKVLFN